MKKSLLFLPLLGLASNVAAQELRGVVTDAGILSPYDLHRYFADGNAGEYSDKSLGV